MSEFVLSDFILEKHPELERADFRKGIMLMDEGDGAYIRKWDHSEPIHPDLAPFVNLKI